MNNKNNCIICGKELVYSIDYDIKTCAICHNSFESNVSCEDGHYICDACHSADANRVIINYCLNTDSDNPVEIAESIMRHPSVKMHGPEHHFLVPAVLLTAYYNKTGNKAELKHKLLTAEKRAKNVLGGFCGFCGACGAGIGTGIFTSVLTEATPLTKKSWSLSNLATAGTLTKIGNEGGPRCCKRETFIAILNMYDFIKDNFNAELTKPERIICTYPSLNRECTGKNCKFHKYAKENIDIMHG